MDWLYYSALGIGLALDAFAVSITTGISIQQMRLKHALRIAFFFGFFQAFMPLVGWIIGEEAQTLISSIDHWVAFILLELVGLKMIYEGCKVEAKVEKESNPLNIHILLALAVATSIDALVVGVTFSVVHIDIVTPIIIIGVITFFMSLSGVYLGNRYGHIFEWIFTRDNWWSNSYAPWHKAGN